MYGYMARTTATGSASVSEEPKISGLPPPEYPILIRLAPDHHAIHMLQVCFGLFQRLDTTVNRHCQMRKVTLQLIHTRIIERRISRFSSGLTPKALTCVDDEHLTLAFAGNGIDEIAEKFIAVLGRRCQYAFSPSPESTPHRASLSRSRQPAAHYPSDTHQTCRSAPGQTGSRHSG